MLTNYSSVSKTAETDPSRPRPRPQQTSGLETKTAVYSDTAVTKKHQCRDNTTNARSLWLITLYRERVI